jgi:hypothetical protein
MVTAETYGAARPVVPFVWVNDLSALIVLLHDIILQKRDRGTEQLQQENLTMRSTSESWQVKMLDTESGGYSMLTGASSRRLPIAACGEMTQRLRSRTSPLRSSGGLRTVWPHTKIW